PVLNDAGEPKLTPSILNCAVPVGVPAVEVTVAVKVTFWASNDGLGDEVSAVEVDAFCAVTVSVTGLAALKLLSPAWSYFTVQVPVPLVIVKVAPTFVQTPALL